MEAKGADSELQDREFELERERVAIERKKLELEFRKLKVEWWKAALTIGSIGIPLLVVMITVIFGYYSERQRANTEFQMKAAEIVLAHQDPHEMKGRARILKTLFKERFSPEFGEDFDDEKYWVPIFPERKDLIQLLADHRNQQADIIGMWRAAYPDDKWVEALQPSINQKK